MKITPGIDKSFDSAFFGVTDPVVHKMFVMKYKGRVFNDPGKNRVKIFSDEGHAKKFLIAWVKNVFWQGEYWQSCKTQIKDRCNIEVDFSETIKILPQYGLVSRFDEPKNVKMFKDLATELLKNGTVSIDPLVF